MQILPGVYKFDTGPFNWYVVEEAGRLAVIDAGFPGHYATFLAGLASIGRSVGDVAGVVLTHAHADHTGFAARLKREHNVPVFVHRADLAGVARPLNLPWAGLLSNAWRPYTARMLLHATFHGVIRVRGVSGAIPFDDGAKLDLPGRPEVIHCPGHTPGEVALVLPGRGVLFSGDVLVTRNLFTGEVGPPQLPGRPLNADDALARRSLSRLAELGRVTMLPGHGTAWAGEMVGAVELAGKG